MRTDWVTAAERLRFRKARKWPLDAFASILSLAAALCTAAAFNALTGGFP